MFPNPESPSKHINSLHNTRRDFLKIILTTLSFAQEARADSTPTITLKLGDSGGSEDKTGEFNLEWKEISSTVSQDSSNNMGKTYAPTSKSTQGSDSQNAPLSKLTIKYNGNSSSSDCKTSTTDCQITIPNQSNNTMTIDAKNNNLQIGNDGKGTLVIDTGGNGGELIKNS